MTNIQATPTDGVESLSLSDDGETVLLRFKALSSGYQDVSIPLRNLAGLLAVAHHLLEQTQPNVSYPVEWWEAGRDKNSDQFVLSFRVPDSFRMAFHIDRTAAQNLRDALSSALGDIPVESTGKTLN